MAATRLVNGTTRFACRYTQLHCGIGLVRPPLSLKWNTFSTSTSTQAPVDVPQSTRALVLEYPIDLDSALPTLSAKTIPVGPLGPLELLIKVEAASVNPIDVKMAEGYGRSLLNAARGSTAVLGRDGSGTVVALGSDVWNHKVGDEVWMCTDPTRVGGTFAEYATVSVNEVGAKPPSLSHAEAASLPFAGVTAWRALVDYAKLIDPNSNLPIAFNKRVFVHGGSGAIGKIAVEMMVAKGCQVAVSCSARSAQRMKEMGCEVVVDYARPEGLFVQLLQAGWDDVDVFMDNVGVTETEEDQIMELLRRKKGHLVSTAGPLLRQVDEQGLLRGLTGGALGLLSKKLKWGQVGMKYDWVLSDPISSTTPAVLAHLEDMVDDGVLHAYVDTSSSSASSASSPPSSSSAAAAAAAASSAAASSSSSSSSQWRGVDAIGPALHYARTNRPQDKIVICMG